MSLNQFCNWLSELSKLGFKTSMGIPSVSKMGTVGMGMVLDFGTPWHTTYPYCGVAGTHGLNISEVKFFSSNFSHFFSFSV